MNIRKAKITDIRAIHELLGYFSKKDLLLPRSLSALYNSLRDFTVAEEEGNVVGCCALHPCWEDLGEIKSLAVSEEYQQKGIGEQLVQFCLDEAPQLGIKRIFVLTYIPKFFEKFGFRKIPKDELPHKVWKECLACPKFPNCGEIALIRE